MKKSDQKAKNVEVAEEKEEKAEGEQKVEKEIDLVTGANGKLGRELIKSLLKKGDVVRALVRSKENIVELPPGVVPYIGDITHQKVLDDACNGVDNVYHLAAAVSEYKYTTEELIHINVEGTRNVLDAAEKGGAKHFIFTSTVDVYGRKRRDVLTEESPLKPSDKYGYSKMLAENIVKEYANTLPYTILGLLLFMGHCLKHRTSRYSRRFKRARYILLEMDKTTLHFFTYMMPFKHLYCREYLLR